MQHKGRSIVTISWASYPAISLLVVVAMGAGLSGCATFEVTGERGGTPGIAYYLPKPYLLVTKNVSTPGVTPKEAGSGDEKNKEGADDNSNSANSSESYARDPVYTFQVLYLPDVAAGKQYAKAKPGLGSVSAELALVNGWQLSSAKIGLDSKVPETLTALGSVAAAPAFAPAAGQAGTGFVDAALKLAEIFVGAEAMVDTEDVSSLRQRAELLAPGVWLIEIGTNCEDPCDAKTCRVTFGPTLDLEFNLATGRLDGITSIPRVGRSRYLYRDERDNGIDPENPGCSVEYDRPWCPQVPTGKQFGDRCLTQFKLEEHYNQECHEPNDPNHFRVIDCDAYCGSRPGRCEVVNDFCGSADSARCVCE